MKIDSASYSLTSSHLAYNRDESNESLRTWKGDRRPDFDAQPGALVSAVSLSAAARAQLAEDIRTAMASLPASQAIKPVQAPEVAAMEEASDAVDSDPFLALIRSMVEMLTGQSIRVFSARDLQRSATPPSLIDPTAAVQAAKPQASAPRAGFGVEYDYHAVHEGFEQTKVSAEGSIRTSDGQQISFKLDLIMTRSYREETSLSLRAGDAVRKDPLVLNFDGSAAQLSDRHFAFDFDSDGRLETLALLAAGSGYLAIDRNGNDRIDSGRELFGPTTNSGFGELSSLDSDDNGWIDENDLAFASLRAWTPDAKGGGALEALQQRQVGAIAVNAIASPFELRGTGDANLGAIAATGVFLADDGRVGSVQEVDLTVR
ncbi:MAG: hypothetical protein A3H93_04030 [Rhodocyclales bacterium RIFCSPLOWO2_02_FULL_63_24]|nr:MAG: hypothetical protein A3H93_04030 [Rhodocyclales bacterium RIFCSPLOWO2_02_FULL_63_24]